MARLVPGWGALLFLLGPLALYICEGAPAGASAGDFQLKFEGIGGGLQPPGDQEICDRGWRRMRDPEVSDRGRRELEAPAFPVVAIRDDESVVTCWVQ